MRIIGNLDFPGIKATVFKMDDRISVKFETGLYEQTFKFRSGEGIETVEDIQAMATPAFLAGIQEGFSRLHQLRIKALDGHPDAIPDFEEII